MNNLLIRSHLRVAQICADGLLAIDKRLKAEKNLRNLRSLKLRADYYGAVAKRARTEIRELSSNS